MIFSLTYGILRSLFISTYFSTLLVGMQTGEATMENSIEFPQKIKNGTAFGPSISIAGIIA